MTPQLTWRTHTPEVGTPVHRLYAGKMHIGTVSHSLSGRHFYASGPLLDAGHEKYPTVDQAKAWLEQQVLDWFAAVSETVGPPTRACPVMPVAGAAPHPLTIPWSVAEMAYSVYVGRYGRSQSLEEMAARGGFGATELDRLLPDWRERAARSGDQHDALVTARAALTDMIAEAASPNPHWPTVGQIGQVALDQLIKLIGRGP